jgi:aryl-alcohol dehydrogenase-like predicted oxidoreductase
MTDPRADAAGTWTLGDLMVNRMGFGAMRLPQLGAALVAASVPRDRAAAITVLRRAVDLGVNHIDTAAFYFSPLRSANELINSALAPYPADLVIVTKVGPGRHPSGEWLDAIRPDELRGQVEENLRQLGRDHLDVVNLRRTRHMDSIGEHFGALAELRQAGLIRHLGLSGVRPEHLTEAQAIAPVVCVQNSLGLGARQSDPLLERCGQEGIAFVPFFAVAGTGRERGSTGEEPAAVLDVARALSASPAQIRLAWTLARGRHVLAIPGTGDLAHLADNVAAAAIELSPEQQARLDPLG